MAHDTHKPFDENHRLPQAPTELRPSATTIVRKALAQAGVLCVRIVGHPGSGKTELIETTLRNLAAPRRVAVIVVNPAASRDAERLRSCCGKVEFIDAAIPTASAVCRAIGELNLAELDMILIEAAGGLAPLQDLGQDATVALFAVSGGDDKAAEYRTLLTAASAVVVTKADLRQHVRFDPVIFQRDVRAINPGAEMFELSGLTAWGVEAWVAWLERMRVAKFTKGKLAGAQDSSPEAFVG